MNGAWGFRRSTKEPVWLIIADIGIVHTNEDEIQNKAAGLRLESDSHSLVYMFFLVSKFRLFFQIRRSSILGWRPMDIRSFPSKASPA